MCVMLGATSVLLCSTAIGAERGRDSSQADVDIEEVVVTATKRRESLQKLPQAVTAITGERLEELNALSFQDYFRDVPGLMMYVDDRGRFDFTIRGVSDNSLSMLMAPTSSTVAQYIDEIPVTATGGQVDMRLVDIERIEVLRGPQGTLYGEGSLSGTVRILTKKPDLNGFAITAEARGSETYKGGTNHQESLMLNLPLVEDKLALRVNYFNAADSGYINAVSVREQITFVNGARIIPIVTGTLREDINDSRGKGGRVMALYAPTDSLSILAEVIKTETETGNLSTYNARVGDLTSPVVCPTPANAPSKCFSLRTYQKPELYNLTVNADLGWASIVSSSSYSQSERLVDVYTLMPGEQIGGIAADDATESDAFTQEIRLLSPLGWSERWSYAVGAFYTRSHVDNVGKAAVGTTGVPFSDSFREIAGFGELGYKLNAKWDVRLGLRQSELRQDSNVAGAVLAPGQPITFRYLDVNTRYTPTTARAVLNYTINDNAIVYASASNGFRKGGPNLPGPVVWAELPAYYRPDKTTSYEIGWKLTMPTVNATFNGSVYHIDWKDVQTMGLSATTPPFNYFTNGGDVAVDGLDLEGGIELMRGLMLRGSFSYIDARLAEDFLLRTTPLTYRGREGDPMPFVAPISGSASLNYRRPLGASGFNGFTSLNGQYQDNRHSDYNPATQDPRGPSYALMESYWTVNTQIGVESDQWRVALYVDNLLDERAQLLRMPNPSPGYAGHFIEITTRPRTIGMAVKWSFD